MNKNKCIIRKYPNSDIFLVLPRRYNPQKDITLISSIPVILNKPKDLKISKGKYGSDFLDKKPMKHAFMTLL